MLSRMILHLEMSSEGGWREEGEGKNIKNSAPAEFRASQIQVSGWGQVSILQKTFDKKPFYTSRGLIHISNVKIQKYINKKEFLWRNNFCKCLLLQSSKLLINAKALHQHKAVFLLLVLADK